MPPSKSRVHLVLLPVVALLVILPLLRNGCSCGHDFDFHLLNWLEAARQFSHGNLHPQWAETPAWNAGEPRFVFYPPISWTLGALLTLALTHLPHLPQAPAFALAPILYTWLALTGSGFALHALIRRYTGPTASLLAATFYIVNPYTLFTAYERTAYAELLAAAWIPLLLLALLPPPGGTDPGRISIPRLALPLALLWLTNAPAAVMGSYTAVLLVLVRLVDLWRRTHNPRLCTRLTVQASAGTLLGLGLAAFYIAPAAYEQRWVQISMAVIPGMRIQDNFLFGHAPATMPDAPAHDAVLHTASIIAALLLTLTLALLTIAHRRSQPQPASASPPLLPFASLTAAIGLLLTPASLALWQHLPELAFLQFPWRLLAILACACAAAAGITLSGLRLNSLAGSLLSLFLAAIFIAPAYTSFHQACDPADTPQARLALFHSSRGSDPTDEYTPTTADNDFLRTDNPPLRLATKNDPGDDPPTSQPPSNTITGPAPRHLDLDAPAPETLILNLRDYPAWQVRLNGLVVTARRQRDDGLLAIPIPAGHDHIDLAYTRTSDRTVGEAISAASFLLLLLLLRRHRKAASIPPAAIISP